MEKGRSTAKNIVIVGTSSGLGKALAILLIKKGHRLFLLSRKVDSTPFPSGKITKITCDVTSKESVKGAFKKIDKHTRKLDVLINCAGIGLEKSLEQSSFEEIAEVIKTNLTGIILVSKEGYKRMIKKRSGHIINVSSTSGKKARANETVYCASKWGLAGFTESLRLEAKDKKIRVTTVYPGGMKTDFYVNNPKKDTSGFMDPRYVAEQIINVIESDTTTCPSELVIERN